MINRKNMKPTITICLAILLAACNTQKKQETDNNSASLKNIPQAVGNDRDEHGCLTSVGYTWSEVQKDCIRLFEKGIRVDAADGSERSAFIVFSPDSTLAELFFSDEQPKEILERRTLPTGKYAWNIEDDDTKNVRFIDGVWTISQRNKLIYTQSKDELGPMQTFTYEGLLPAASGPGIFYSLTIKSKKHSGDGTFSLALTYKEAENGKDKTFTYEGKRFTLRGMAGNENATVWQLITNDHKQTFNFLVENDQTLTLLNDKLEKSQSNLNYQLKKVN